MIAIEDGKNLLTRLEGWVAPFDCFDNLGQGETDSAQFHQKRPIKARALQNFASRPAFQARVAGYGLERFQGTA